MLHEIACLFKMAGCLQNGGMFFFKMAECLQNGGMVFFLNGGMSFQSGGLLLKMPLILLVFLSISGLNCSQNCEVVRYCYSTVAVSSVGSSFRALSLRTLLNRRPSLDEFISASKRPTTSAHPAVITKPRNMKSLPE
jgi:hypothetical protein